MAVREAEPRWLAPGGEGGRPRPRGPALDVPQHADHARDRGARPHPLQAGQDPGLVLHGTRERGAPQSASAPRWGRTTSGRRSTATWACTSRAASSRGGSSRSTWAARAARRAGATGTCTWRCRSSGLHPMVSHLPAMLPVATGMALAFKIRGERRVAVGWFGEGAAARGDAHEAMNIAGVRQLPIVFICDNNQWAYSTPTYLSYPVEHIADRAAAYGFDGVVVDGTDVLAVYREAKARDREGARGRRPDARRVPDPPHGGPRGPRRRVLRPEGDVRAVGGAGPDRALPLVAPRPRRADGRGGGRDRVLRQAAPERRARAGRRVAAPGSVRRSWRASSPRPRTSTRRTTSEPMPELTYIQAISDGLRQEMRRDQRVFVLGEDVGVYGGAFKVTLGFQEEFGPWRVIDTPLSETAIVGGATGAALMGLRPVAEMQFADFISCAWDHLVTVAAKQFFRGRTPVPIVVRLPVRRRLLGRPVPLAEPGELVRAHPRAQDRVPGDAARREGPARDRDRGPEPGPLLRAQAPVPADQGRGAGGALHRPLRPGERPPRGRRRGRRHLGGDGAHGDRGGRRAREGGLRGRGARPAHAHPLGQGEGARERPPHVEGARAARGHAHGRLRRRDRGDDRGGGVRGSRRARHAASRRPTRRSRSRPPLEKAFIPQTEDVAKALRELAAY